jgi:uncharacterized protein (DUF2267 family)
MASDYDRFVEVVEGAARMDRPGAERAIRATLQTLAERIDVGESRHLASQLPPEVAPFVGRVGGAQRFDVDEFLRREAEREGVDLAAAEDHARAVFAALGQAVTPGELDDLAAELSKDYTPLLPRGPYAEVLPADEVILRVAERAGLDVDPARRATEAVLETLAERIAGGEVEDLVSRLPVTLHAPLNRGVQRSEGRPTRLSLEEFLQRVADREGAELSAAREHTRAVFATLRDAVGDEEFFDVTDQLPTEFRSLLPRAR